VEPASVGTGERSELRGAKPARSEPAEIAHRVAEILKREADGEGIDRMYCNVYVPSLQYEHSRFFRYRRGQRLPSAALILSDNPKLCCGARGLCGPAWYWFERQAVHMLQPPVWIAPLGHRAVQTFKRGFSASMSRPGRTLKASLMALKTPQRVLHLATYGFNLTNQSRGPSDPASTSPFPPTRHACRAPTIPRVLANAVDLHIAASCHCNQALRFLPKFFGSDIDRPLCGCGLDHREPFGWRVLKVDAPGLCIRRAFAAIHQSPSVITQREDGTGIERFHTLQNRRV
jgi:hypothetical protein